MGQEIEIASGATAEFIDLTPRVQEVVQQSGAHEGACVVFVPHTTAGVTLNENWDPAVRSDMLHALARLVPPSREYRHAEGNSPAHIQASLVGASVTIPIVDGRLALGTWQGIYLAEFDGPRRRRVLVQVLRA